MALISMRQMLDHAAENGYGVPAFNVNNLEQMRAIMEGADQTDSPVIVQASAGARKYAGPNFLRQLILRNRGAAVHDQMGIGNALVDRFDSIYRQYVAGRRSREFVSTMRCTNRNGQRINPRALYKIRSLLRIREQHIHAECPFGTNAIFFTSLACLERSKTTQFPFNRHSTGMGHVYGPLSDLDVVVVAGGRFLIFF